MNHVKRAGELCLVRISLSPTLSSQNNPIIYLRSDLFQRIFTGMFNATQSQQGDSAPLISLAQACVGKPLHVRSLDAAPSVCQRLQELGFCEDAEIIKISQGTALICQVCGVRMALSKGLAQQILVQPCSSDSAP